MPTEVYLVKVGMNMTEGVVEEWYIPDGGTVSEGELLYRLETEKVNLDVDAEATGTVKHVIGEGITREPGDVVGYIYAEGEAIPDVLPGTAGAPESAGTVASREIQEELTLAPAAQPVTARSSAANGRLKASPIARRLAAERGVNLAAVQGTGPGGRVVEADVLAAEIDAVASTTAAVETEEGVQRSSPMARKVARELGVNLDTVSGTGPGGRITKDDVEAAASTGPAASTRSFDATPGVVAADEVLPLRGMRKTIARRMHASLQDTAQLTMDMDVVMDDAVKLRSQLIDEWQEEGLRPTYTDLVIRAVARSLEKHRLINATMTDSEIIRHGAINIGMAVALPEGLIVPVVKNANLLSVQTLAEESSRLALAARDGTLTPDDLQGGTFTVTALGMFGVDSFTPIINSPEAGILGVNRIRDDVAWEGDKPVKQQRMKLSLTWDHRVLDGAPAAEFLGSVRDLLEAPYRLLL
jgi:pyruvate dehydrogenase E2 component (dihydrolipoamide acetyltransferase)